MSMADEVFMRLSHCEHLMRTNVEIENYSEEYDMTEEDTDMENPGFTKGWDYFLDMVSNSIIAVPRKEIIENENDFDIEIRISDEIIARIKGVDLIEEFLRKSEMKSHYFANVANLIPQNKSNRKLGL